MNWLKNKKKKRESTVNVDEVPSGNSRQISRIAPPGPTASASSSSSSSSSSSISGSNTANAAQTVNLISPSRGSLSSTEPTGNNMIAMADEFVKRQHKMTEEVEEQKQEQQFEDKITQQSGKQKSSIFPAITESEIINDNRRSTQSFAQHLTRFVNNDAGDLDAVVEAMTTDIVPFDESMDDDQLKLTEINNVENDRQSVASDYSLSPRQSRPQQPRKNNNYKQRLSIYHQRANLRRGTITKLKKELDEDDKRKLARLKKKNGKKSSHNKQKSINKKKYKIRDPYQSNQETVNMNIDINNGNKQKKKNNNKHQRYATSSAVIPSFNQQHDDYNDDGAMWYKYLIDQHNEMMQQLTYFDLIESEIPSQLEASSTDKYIIERTLILQMKHWIARYGIPAMGAHTQIHQLKSDLVKINEEANQFEEEAIQLMQKVFNLENQLSDLHKEKIKLNETNTELTKLYDSQSDKYNKLESLYNKETNELKEQIDKLKKNKYIHENTHKLIPNHSRQQHPTYNTTQSVDALTQQVIALKLGTNNSGSSSLSRPSTPPSSNDHNDIDHRPLTPPPPPRRVNTVTNTVGVHMPSSYKLKQSKSAATINVHNIQILNTSKHLNSPPHSHRHVSPPPPSTNNDHIKSKRSISSFHQTPPPPSSTKPLPPNKKKGSFHNRSAKTLTHDFFPKDFNKNDNNDKPPLPPRSDKTKRKSMILTSMQLSNDSLQTKYDKLNKMNISLEKEVHDLRQYISSNSGIQTKKVRRKSKKLDKDLGELINEMSADKLLWETEKEDFQKEIKELKNKINLLQNNKNSNNHRVRPPPPRPYIAKNKISIKANVALNENDINLLEYIDKNEDSKTDDATNMVEITAEIDEYENSDDGWVSDEDSENKENKKEIIENKPVLSLINISKNNSNSNKPLLSQSKTDSAVSPKMATTPMSLFNRKPPSRPPPTRPKKKKSAKITKVFVPTNKLKTGNIPNQIGDKNDSKQKQMEQDESEENGGFNSLLAKFVKIDDENKKSQSSPNTPTASHKLNNKNKKIISRKPPPSRALPPRTIIANVKRVKQHYFKPKKHGFLSVESSSLWDEKLIKKQPKFYVAIDGLPSTTNISTTEPEWKKRKKNDILTPFLCFFKNKKLFDDLINSCSNFAVRDITFQKKFSLYANGIIRLDEACIDYKLQSLLEKLDINNDNNDDNKNNEDENCKLFIATNINQSDQTNLQIHTFLAENEKSRNQWFASMNHMINKRKDSRARRNIEGNTNQNPTTGRYKMRLW